MFDRIAEFFIFGLTPMLVVMLAAPSAPQAGEQPVVAGTMDKNSADKDSGDKDSGGDATIFGQMWNLRFIDGVGAVDSKATFHLEEDGKVTGRAPCNRYFASATVDGDKIEIGKPGATMMACEQPLMAQEGAFFTALEKVASFRIENGNLVLAAADGRDLLRFAASA